MVCSTEVELPVMGAPDGVKGPTGPYSLCTNTEFRGHST